MQGLFARVGSGDPVRVLCLFHNNYTGYCCIHLLCRSTYNLSLPRLSANYYGLPTTVQLRAAHESRCSLVGVSQSTALQVLYCTCLERYHYGTIHPVIPTTKEPVGTVGINQPRQGQSSLSTPRQLLVYDETPAGRPLPTLWDIHQANLRRVLEEEGADTPCDICAAPDHDYQTCPGGRYLESQDPTRSQEVPESPYCGWCQQYGHISANCLAKYYDDSMNARFPPKGRRVQKPLRQYDCRRCGQRHPFNVYCPYITYPPVIPGECKSCGAVTNVHDEECQYVEVKDEIGICSFCGNLDHTYAQCPEREEEREIARKEREKNRKNKKKGKAKVKIVSGILTK